MKKILIPTVLLGLSLSCVTDYASASEKVTSNTQNTSVVKTPAKDSSDKPYGTMGVHTLVYNEGYQGEHVGSWRKGPIGKGPSTLTLSKTVRVDNTYSGTLTASISQISSAVGFSVTKSNATTASYSIKVPSGKRYQIKWRPIYKRYRVKQQTFSSTGAPISTKYVYPLKYDHLEYTHVTVK